VSAAESSAATLAAAGPLGLALDVMARAHLERANTAVIDYDTACDLVTEWTIPIRGASWTLGATCGWAGEDVGVDHVIDALVEAGIWREVGGAGFALLPLEATA